jgi:hypothetical protein
MAKKNKEQHKNKKLLKNTTDTSSNNFWKKNKIYRRKISKKA